jgi:hypothetical protein
MIYLEAEVIIVNHISNLPHSTQPTTRTILNMLKDELANLLKGMQVPVNRNKDYVWLEDNLHEKNKCHKNFEDAMRIIVILNKRWRK